MAKFLSITPDECVSPEWASRAFLCNAQRREMGANRLGDLARRQVRVVFFRHARVGVAELFGDDPHRNATQASVKPCVCRITWTKRQA